LPANRNPVPYVYLRRAHIAGGELPSAAGGMMVRVFGFGGLAVKFEGMVVKTKSFLGPACKKNLCPLMCFGSNLENSYKIVEKIQKLQM
jgi:hypothetical protein